MPIIVGLVLNIMHVVLFALFVLSLSSVTSAAGSFID